MLKRWSTNVVAYRVIPGEKRRLIIKMQIVRIIAFIKKACREEVLNYLSVWNLNHEEGF